MKTLAKATTNDCGLTDFADATLTQQTFRDGSQDEPVISTEAMRGFSDIDLALRLGELKSESSREGRNLHQKLYFEKKLRQLVGNVDIDESMRDFLEQYQASPGLRTLSGNQSIQALHLLGPAHCIAVIERRNWYGAGIESHQTIHLFKDGQARHGNDLKTRSSYHTEPDHGEFQIFGINEVDYDQMTEQYSARVRYGYGKEGTLQIMSDMTCKFNDFFEI